MFCIRSELLPTWFIWWSQKINKKINPFFLKVFQSDKVFLKLPFYIKFRRKSFICLKIFSNLQLGLELTPSNGGNKKSLPGIPLLVIRKDRWLLSFRKKVEKCHRDKLIFKGSVSFFSNNHVKLAEIIRR